MKADTWLPKRFPADLPTEYLRWRPEYYGEWVDRPHWNQLRELAEHYHDETEAFDQLVCTGRNEHGVAFPRSHDESHSSAAYARRMREELGWLARCLGFTAEDWTDEVSRAGERLDRLMRERRRG